MEKQQQHGSKHELIVSATGRVWRCRALWHARQAGHWQHLTLLKGVKKGRGNMLARTSTQLDQSPSPWTLLPPGARTLGDVGLGHGWNVECGKWNEVFV